MTKQASAKRILGVCERTVWMVFEHEGEHTSQWAAVDSVPAKIGCTGETLRGDDAGSPNAIGASDQKMDVQERSNRRGVVVIEGKRVGRFDWLQRNLLGLLIRERG